MKGRRTDRGQGAGPRLPRKNRTFGGDVLQQEEETGAEGGRTQDIGRGESGSDEADAERRARQNSAAVHALDRICVILAAAIVVLSVFAVIDHNDLVLSLRLIVGLSAILNILIAAAYSVREQWVRAVVFLIVGLGALSILIYVVL